MAGPSQHSLLRCRTEGAPPHKPGDPLSTPIRFVAFEDKMDPGGKSVGCTRTHCIEKET